MSLSVKRLERLVRDTFRDWRKISPGILAGGLSYFASISLPPLVVIIGAALGNLLEGREILLRLDETVGSKAAILKRTSSRMGSSGGSNGTSALH